jgi:hypothetical protein
MAIDILQIAPPSEQSATVPFGGETLTVRPLKMAQLARIAQRFEAFRKVYFSKEYDDNTPYRSAAMIEAYPAIVCAALGKDGKPDSHLIEAHIAKFDDDDITGAAQAIMRLTNGDPAAETEGQDEKAPLPEGAAGQRQHGDGAGATSTTSS